MGSEMCIRDSLRQAPLPPEGATVISNNGALEDAGNALVEFLSP